MHKNLKLEVMQWQSYRLRGGSFGNKKNIPWPRKRKLENQTIIHFAVYSTPTY